jgi:hypothetical protein
MDEKSLLETAAEDVAKLRYLAYVLFDDNERLSVEIDLRLRPVANLILSRLQELEQAKRSIKYELFIERSLSKLRAYPKVDYSTKTPKSDSTLFSGSRNLPPFKRH